MPLCERDRLFPWNRLADSPDLRTVKDFFAGLRDGPLLEALAGCRRRSGTTSPPAPDGGRKEYSDAAVHAALAGAAP